MPIPRFPSEHYGIHISQSSVFFERICWKFLISHVRGLFNVRDSAPHCCKFSGSPQRTTSLALTAHWSTHFDFEMFWICGVESTVVTGQTSDCADSSLVCLKIVDMIQRCSKVIGSPEKCFECSWIVLSRSWLVVNCPNGKMNSPTT